MFGRAPSLPLPPTLPRALYAPVGAVIGGAMLALSLSQLAEPFMARLLLFYVGATAAYALMPYVRRGDIPFVAAWVVLLAELAPCVVGEMISPVKVSADVLGVLMATGPIYVARLRQMQQGDVRPGGRRANEAG